MSDQQQGKRQLQPPQQQHQQPGPIWTPLIPSTFPPDKVQSFGADVPMKRLGQPAEVAPCYVCLACGDASSIRG